MPSQEKKDKVKQYKKWFDKSDSFLVLRYRGLRVSEASEFRGQVAEKDARLRVLKNTLTRIALTGTDKEGLIPLIDGPVAILFAGEEPTAVARLVKDFSKGRKEFYLQGGMISGRVLDGRQVEAYALLPPRDVMLAQALGQVAVPLSGLVGVCAGPIHKLLYLLKAVAETRPAEEPAPEVVDAPPEKAEAPPEPEKAEAPPEPAEADAAPGQADDPGEVVKEEERGEEAAEAEAPEDKQES